MKLLLSVIIPTYKRLERLKKTFPLIVEEVSNEIEFIILDNASEDGTEDYIKDFINTDSRIRYIKNHINIGANRSIYRGYLESKSNWICFIPDDDFIEKGFFTELIEVIGKNQDCGVILNANTDNIALNRTSSRRIKSGIEAFKASFNNSGVITGLTFNKKYIKQEYWTLDNSIYPQIGLAVNLSLNNDIYIHLPKNKIILGKEDSIDSIVNSRPADFGVIERLEILLESSKNFKNKERLNLINSLSINLFNWGIHTMNEIYYDKKDNSIIFLKNLLKNSFIKSSMSFHGLLILKFILNNKINLRFKISIGLKILKSIFLSIFNKNLYQSFFYLMANLKDLISKLKK